MTSGPSDAKFQHFLKEIDDHFVYVLKDVLGWEVLEQPEFTVGGGNVVIRFKTASGRFVFRVPQYSPDQLRRVTLAYRHLGETGLMPEKIYQDGKCVLEKYVDGIALSARTSDQALVTLARNLALVHALPSDGYGPLSHGSTGLYADAKAYYSETPPPAMDEDDEEELAPDEISTLRALFGRACQIPDRLPESPCHLGHGDMWRSNIVVSQHQITLIDWDRLGSYPREHDFVFLADADLSQHQKDLVFGNYRFSLNPALVNWFSLRRVLGNPKTGKREKLAVAVRHGLLA